MLYSQWVEARDATQHCAMDSNRAPTTKNDLTPNINSAEAEKTCFMEEA